MGVGPALAVCGNTARRERGDDRASLAGSYNNKRLGSLLTSTVCQSGKLAGFKATVRATTECLKYGENCYCYLQFWDVYRREGNYYRYSKFWNIQDFKETVRNLAYANYSMFKFLMSQIGSVRKSSVKNLTESLLYNCALYNIHCISSKIVNRPISVPSTSYHEKNSKRRNSLRFLFKSTLDSPVRYHTDEFRRKGKRRIIVYGLVTRYGPQASCQRKPVSLFDVDQLKGDQIANAAHQSSPDKQVSGFCQNGESSMQSFEQYLC
ncbi:hypothetical protein WN51_12561 [Melipona quadrifasciata]|uniref:Uncharacterized protein n=1 Tax=Melipona quadrifasciata TaxID=166423 RepID=A0A0M9A4I0_9HYME|nr:hypothetical protein WN51_12561 [Melipona quadrifasciata]